MKVVADKLRTDGGIGWGNRMGEELTVEVEGGSIN